MPLLTVTDLELEHAKRRIAELEYKLGRFGPLQTTPTVAKEIELSGSLPETLRLPMFAGIEAGYDPMLRLGVKAWARGEELLQYGYYVEDHHYETANIPFVLDKMHERFIHALHA